MAGELTIQLSAFNFIKSGRSISKQIGTQAIDVNGLHYSQQTATIGTTEETLAKGDVTDVGFVLVKNNDSTNFVTVGTVSGNLSVKVKKGEVMVGRANGNTVHAKADTAPVDIEYIIISD